MKALLSRLFSAVSRAFTLTLGSIDLLLKTVIAASLLLLSIAAFLAVGVFDRAVYQYERFHYGERQISVNFSEPIEIEPLSVRGDLEMDAEVRLKCLEEIPVLVDRDGDGIKESVWLEKGCDALLNDEKEVNWG